MRGKSRKSKVNKSDMSNRGKSGYLLYADEVRAEIKEELEAKLGEDFR